MIYGPSDVLGTFQTMGVVQDMGPWFPEKDRGDFVEGALTYLPAAGDPAKRDLVQVADKFGNHLALVYNRKFVPNPPKTTDELVALAVRNTIDENGDGRKDRYGLVWNFTEPFFGIPFLTGYGGWVFADRPRSAAGSPPVRPEPSLDTPQAVAAWKFMQSLQTEHGVAPQNCDYELADSLFKTGRAAMIINGDWSWADYLKRPRDRRGGRGAADGVGDRRADADDVRAEGVFAQCEHAARNCDRRDGVCTAHDERRSAAADRA